MAAGTAVTALSPRPEPRAGAHVTIPSPMKLQWFHILLALKEGSLHGYGIQRAVLDRTGGSLRLWPATLYRLLGALEEERYIRGAEGPEEEPPDQRRQYYELTRAGRDRLRNEAAMMADWARAAGIAGGGWEGGAR
jgi:DNA-binding PadR family transcriptional regulator